MLKCIKLHKRIHIIVILHIYSKRVPSVRGRWFQRKSSRARIKKQFSASLKWVSIFGSQILTLSLQAGSSVTVAAAPCAEVRAGGLVPSDRTQLDTQTQQGRGIPPLTNTALAYSCSVGQPTETNLHKGKHKLKNKTQRMILVLFF